MKKEILLEINGWKHPSYKFFLLVIPVGLLPIITFVYFKNLTLIFSIYIIIYLITVIYLIFCIINSKKNLEKIFFNTDYSKIIKAIDSVLEDLKISFSKKNKIQPRFFPEISKEIYRIKNRPFFIKVVINIQTENSLGIGINKISKEDQRVINKIIKKIDHKLENKTIV